MLTAATLTLIAASAAAACSDVASRRVPNWLNLAILALGLGWRAIAHSPLSPLAGLAGAGVGLGLLIVPFAFRWIGGGDVKLVAALGAWLGPIDVITACVCGLVGGGLLSAIMLATASKHDRRDIVDNVKFSATTMSAPTAPRRSNALVVPMAVPLGISACVTFMVTGGF